MSLFAGWISKCEMSRYMLFTYETRKSFDQLVQVFVNKRTNNKFNPFITSGVGFDPGPHWWETGALIIDPPPLPPLLRNTDLIHRIRGVPDRMQQRTLYVVSYPSRRVSRLCDDCSSIGLTRLKLIQFISAGLKDIHHVGSPRHSSERTSDRRECRRQLRLAPRQSSFRFGDVLLLIWNLLSQRL